MTNIDKFSKSEMTDGQEKKYLESLYDSHYDQKLKEKYTAQLADQHGVQRENITSIKQKKKPTKMRSLILGVASVAAIFILGFFLLPMTNGGDQMSPQQMATNMIAIEKIDVKRGGQEASQLRLDIISKFNAGKYQEVVALYNSLELMTDVDKYWHGLAYFYSKDYKNAKATFSTIEKTDSFKFNAELTWYKALNYVLLDDPTAAKPLLEKVASTSWKNEEARELLVLISK